MEELTFFMLTRNYSMSLDTCFQLALQVSQKLNQMQSLENQERIYTEYLLVLYKEFTVAWELLIYDYTITV